MPRTITNQLEHRAKRATGVGTVASAGRARIGILLQRNDNKEYRFTLPWSSLAARINPSSAAAATTTHLELRVSHTHGTTSQNNTVTAPDV